MKTGTITPKVQYEVPIYRSVRPLQEAVDLIQPEVLESILGDDQTLVIQEHALRRDSITLMKKTKSDVPEQPDKLEPVNNVDTTYRRGRKWKLMDKGIDLKAEFKPFSLATLKELFKKKTVDKELEQVVGKDLLKMPKCLTISLPGKKKLASIPGDSAYQFLTNAVEKLERLGFK